MGQQRSEARTTLYQDIIDQVPGSVDYWASCQLIGGVLHVTEEGDDPEDRGAPLPVTIEIIAKGWQALLEKERKGGFRHCIRYDRSVRETEQAVAGGDGRGGDYDACVMDAVVQMGLLGELRYG